MKLPKHERFYLLLTANVLAIPYSQQTDLLRLFALFTGYGAVRTNLFFIAGGLGLFSGVSTWAVIRALVLIPLGLYFRVFHGAARKQRVA
ncbi:MAG TPA: hypothetical protein VLX61_10895 [Anaerolineales bacterium]|nr:hypothetical protein [Anaerolineales bacterium]